MSRFPLTPPFRGVTLPPYWFPEGYNIPCIFHSYPPLIAIVWLNSCYIPSSKRLDVALSHHETRSFSEKPWVFPHLFVYPRVKCHFCPRKYDISIYFHEFPIPIHVSRPGPMSMSCRRVVGCARATSLRSWWPRWACRCAVARRKFTPWRRGSPGGVPPRDVNVGEQKTIGYVCWFINHSWIVVRYIYLQNPRVKLELCSRTNLVNSSLGHHPVEYWMIIVTEFVFQPS